MTLHREKLAFGRRKATLGFFVLSLYSVLSLLLPTPARCGAPRFRRADLGGASAGAEWLPSLSHLPLSSPFGK